MKVLFKNTTKYDKENRRNLENFHVHKYGDREIIRYIVLIFALIYMLIFNIIHKNWYFFIALIIAGILVYILIEKEKKEKTKNRKIKEYTFLFYERYIKIRTRREFEKILYFQIKKVFETKENFFLYTDEKHSLILDKDGFEKGTPEEFVIFIKKKCPFKYSNEDK